MRNDRKTNVFIYLFIDNVYCLSAHKFGTVLYTNSIKKIFVKIRAIRGFLISHKLAQIFFIRII